MRILYGVQGTGNGHLSRARAMAAAFAGSALDVDFLFSGREVGRYFDMECFGSFQARTGLTFVNIDGHVNYWRTIIGNRYLRFIRDVIALDLSSYDLVLTDFEPISAWAGRLRGKRVISLGHQPAFDHAVPVANRDLRTSLVMRLFAPGDVRVGMHWDKFGAPILPPLVDAGPGPVLRRPRKVLVYLPFESQWRVHQLLRTSPEFEFHVYAPDSRHVDEANLHLRPTSLEGFRRDLHDCEAVLCNAGFELSSECLALGKRLLVKPQGRQMEQASNALALRKLGYGMSINELDAGLIRDWLSHDRPAPQIAFPDVAAALVRWIEAGDFGPRALESLSESLWRRVRVNTPKLFHGAAKAEPRPRTEPL
ncbi:MAG: MJ1255/VC2487 family glycosyltransferase [Pseudomonadota bacterium]